MLLMVNEAANLLQNTLAINGISDAEELLGASASRPIGFWGIRATEISTLVKLV